MQTLGMVQDQYSRKQLCYAIILFPKIPESNRQLFTIHKITMKIVQCIQRQNGLLKDYSHQSFSPQSLVLQSFQVTIGNLSNQILVYQIYQSICYPKVVLPESIQRQKAKGYLEAKQSFLILSLVKKCLYIFFPFFMT